MKRFSIIIAFLVLFFVAGSLSCKNRKTGNETALQENSVSTNKQEDIISQFPPFTFVRIKYTGSNQSSWLVDYPESDLNFSARFQKVTGIKTDLNGKVLQLTDPNLEQYHFIYIAEGGNILLTPEEVKSLRKYLLGGGFLMVDDFWGDTEWKSLYSQIKRVFPEREPVELNLNHPIFHCVFDLKEKPQVPQISIGIKNQSTGITWEREDAKEAHYYGLYDDNGRMIAILCRNTDLGDGWERITENEYYYREFSLKKAFPMGINIVVYALAHYSFNDKVITYPVYEGRLEELAIKSGGQL